MKDDTQLKVQAYLDNELSPAEARQVAQLISTDTSARETYTLLKDTKEILAHNEPVLAMPESRDFYWSKIQRGIESAERLPAERNASAWWLKLLAPIAGAVALFAILLSVTSPETDVSPRAENTIVKPMHEVEDLAPEVSTITFRSEAEGVTVVWVNNR